MPYDSLNAIWYGAEARTPRTTARDALIEFLSDKLNDPQGPYYSLLGLNNAPEAGDLVEAVVTHSQELASQLFDGGGKNPIVYLTNGPAETETSGRTIEGTLYKGRLHLLKYRLDMGVNDDSAEADDPAADAEADSILGDLVREIIDEGFFDLSDLGLQECEIEGDDEAQRAGDGRNPHCITLAFPAFPTYTPAP